MMIENEGLHKLENTKKFSHPTFPQLPYTNRNESHDFTYIISIYQQ